MLDYVHLAACLYLFSNDKVVRRIFFTAFKPKTAVGFSRKWRNEGCRTEPKQLIYLIVMYLIIVFWFLFLEEYIDIIEILILTAAHLKKWS